MIKASLADDDDDDDVWTWIYTNEFKRRTNQRKRGVTIRWWMQADTVIRREKQPVTRDEEKKPTGRENHLHGYIISSIFFNNSFVYSMACSAWAREENHRVRLARGTTVRTYKQWRLLRESWQIELHWDIAYDLDHRSICRVYSRSLAHHCPHRSVGLEYPLSYSCRYPCSSDRLSVLSPPPRTQRSSRSERERDRTYPIAFITCPIVGDVARGRMHIVVGTLEIVLSLFQPAIRFRLLVVTFASSIGTFFYKSREECQRDLSMASH